MKQRYLKETYLVLVHKSINMKTAAVERLRRISFERPCKSVKNIVLISCSLYARHWFFGSHKIHFNSGFYLSVVNPKIKQQLAN